MEHWADQAAFERCNRTDTDSTLYNAMIHPYVVGPMSVTGFTWYQGEAKCVIIPTLPAAHKLRSWAAVLAAL